MMQNANDQQYDPKISKKMGGETTIPLQLVKIIPIKEQKTAIMIKI